MASIIMLPPTWGFRLHPGHQCRMPSCRVRLAGESLTLQEEDDDREEEDIVLIGEIIDQAEFFASLIPRPPTPDPEPILHREIFHNPMDLFPGEDPFVLEEQVERIARFHQEILRRRHVNNGGDPQEPGPELEHLSLGYLPLAYRQEQQVWLPPPESQEEEDHTRRRVRDLGQAMGVQWVLIFLIFLWLVYLSILNVRAMLQTFK